MSEHRPTRAEVRKDYAWAEFSVEVIPIREQIFDGWLAAEVAVAKAEAWDEGYEVGGEDWQSEYWSSRRTGKTNPYRTERTP